MKSARLRETFYIGRKRALAHILVLRMKVSVLAEEIGAIRLQSLADVKVADL
jgi:hypothetical protein